ncbi:hypothetical protein VN0390_07510 [Helicobacter pylori]|nr:hypothetical protein VN0390_07510 [Helicobacter pylori]
MRSQCNSEKSYDRLVGYEIKTHYRVKLLKNKWHRWHREFLFFLKRLFNKIKVIKRACIFSVFLGGKSLVFQDFCSEKTNFSGYCGGLVIDIAIVFI